MKITHASMQDLAAVAAVEAMCFPPRGSGHGKRLCR